MAAAGPAGNFALAVVAFLALKAGLALGWFMAPDHATFGQLVVPAATGLPTGVPGFVGALLSVLLMLNVLLGVFNLVPLPPLDGASVAGLVLPEGAARSFRGLAGTPGFSLVGLLVAWNLFPHLVHPLFGLVLDALHPGTYYR